MQDGILMQLGGIKETGEHDESMFYSIHIGKYPPWLEMETREQPNMDLSLKNIEFT